ncbi:hypothetical protein NSA56_01765 [Oceanobacillus caeni]|uniref:hypothetical protein n=1 Tax=Oceanobacillus caeni TaxID=405946 RepID=UPI002149B524|nr:hypothetical protein [Oceanobacillus caeni]MCR1833123.1 hypothetical protein [Oceanobacillus caeni]
MSRIPYNKKRYEIVETITYKNSRINIVKQDNLEKNKDLLYNTIAEVLVEQYIEEQKKNK